MDIVKMGAQLLEQNLGLNIDVDQISGALRGLLGGTQDGQVDLAGLAARMMQNGNLSDVIGSWLGDGANKGISADTIIDLLGKHNVSDFASKIGTETGRAAGGLADVIPQMVDKASSGGSLLESFGGTDALVGLAKSFFK